MNIPEAIGLKEEDLKRRIQLSDTFLYAADKLGIEALKFRQLWEQQEGEADFPLLPGETKE